MSRLDHDARRVYLDGVALANGAALLDVLGYCGRAGIGAFRVSSQLFPLATHPISGYTIESLPSGEEVARRLAVAGALARALGIRLSFHPDQFVVLNSIRPEVVDSAIQELEWQGALADRLGADVICLHGGSTAGGVEAAADRLVEGIARLSARTRSRLALENDDRCFGAIDLLPACLAADVPLVLDAHHHRVLSRELTIEAATDWAIATWGEREPYFHLSSPRNAWGEGDPRPHADVIDLADVPAYWLALGGPVTVDVEAKAKERAVLAVRDAVADAMHGDWRAAG